MGTLSSLIASGEARAANFTLTPTITFEVVDGGGSGPFDGNGDEVFPGNFDITAKGTLGETAEIAEFNLNGLLIPQQEAITSVNFQVNSTGAPSFGGTIGSTNGRAPTSLVVRGFSGNGQIDASDFQAGTILDVVNVSQGFGPETFDFNVTSFVESLVSNGSSFAGFSVRASDIGAIDFSRDPKLTITTVPEPSHTLAVLALGAFGAVSMLKRKQKTVVPNK